MKTYLYNFDPLNPNFIQKNWGLHGYTLFLISAQKHRLWGSSNKYPQSMF